MIMIPISEADDLGALNLTPVRVWKVQNFEFKGVVDKILVAVAKFQGHFWTQWGRLPQKTSKTYPFT